MKSKKIVFGSAAALAAILMVAAPANASSIKEAAQEKKQSFESAMQDFKAAKSETVAEKEAALAEIESEVNGSEVVSNVAGIDEQGNMLPTLSANSLEFVEGHAKQFKIASTSGDFTGTSVRVDFTLSQNNNDLDGQSVSIEYLQEDAYLPMPFSTENGVLTGSYGPAGGFPLADVTSDFRATFASAGTYLLTAKIIDIESGLTLASQDFSVTVTSADELIKPIQDQFKAEMQQARTEMKSIRQQAREEFKEARKEFVASKKSKNGQAHDRK